MTSRRITLLLITTALVLVGPVAAANAHSAIIATTPGDGTTITAPPESFSVTANAPMLDLAGEGTGFGMTVTDADGLYYGDGCLTVSGATLSMPATLGGPGDYTLTYQYISGDGHTLSGVLTFVFDPVDAAAAVAGRVEPPVCGQAAPEPVATPSATPLETATPDATASAAPEPASDESGTVLAIVAAIGATLALLAVVIAVVARRGRRPAA